MADQTPEVCAEVFAGGRCGEPEDADCHGFDESHDHRPKSRCHPFRPAEPTPAERPEGVEWRRVGEVGHGEVHWRIDSRDIDAVVSVSLERAISSAAVAEAEARVAEWRNVAYAGSGTIRSMAAERTRLERALEEARAAVREYVEAFDDWNEHGWGTDDVSERFNRVQAADARLRALVATEGEAPR